MTRLRQLHGLHGLLDVVIMLFRCPKCGATRNLPGLCFGCQRKADQ